MTKYVLNSGGIRNNPQRGKEFAAEIVKGLGASPRVLIVLFAQPREDWEKQFVKYQDEFTGRIPKGLNATFELALPDIFKKQIEQSDIVYLQGGDDHLLRYWFAKLKVESTDWRGKVVAGSSAGSDVLVRHFWACDWRACGDGLGFVPAKFIPHFESAFGEDDPLRGPVDWQKALKELEVYGDKDLPVYALKEGEFEVFEVDD